MLQLLTTREMKDRIITTMQTQYTSKIEETFNLWVLTGIDELGWSRYYNEAKDELFRLKQDRDEFVRNVARMNDAETEALYAEMFAS